MGHWAEYCPVRAPSAPRCTVTVPDVAGTQSPTTGHDKAAAFGPPFIASTAIVIGVVTSLSAVPLKTRCTAGVGALAGRVAGTSPVYNTIRTCGVFVALQSAYE